MSRGQFVKDHEAFSRASATRIGKGPVPAAFVNAQRVQIKSISYAERKRAAVMSQVRRIVAAMQLPEGVISQSMHAFEKLAKIVESGRTEAGTDMLAVASIIYGCRLAKVPVAPKKIIDACGIDELRARRSLLRLAATVRERYPAMIASVSSRMAVQVERALEIAREITGLPMSVALVSQIHAAIQRAMLGLPDASVAGTLAYLAARAVSNVPFKLAEVARAVGYSSSSLYNCIARVLAKLGVQLEVSLGEADIAPAIWRLAGIDVEEVPLTPIENVQAAHDTPEAIEIETLAITSPVVAAPAIPIIPDIPITSITTTRSCIPRIHRVESCERFAAPTTRHPRRRHDRPRWRFSRPLPFRWQVDLPAPDHLATTSRPLAFQYQPA